MIFVSGIFFVLQLAVLPGLLLTRRARFDSHLAQGIAVFVTSLLANYLLVVSLTALHQYRSRTVWAVVALELLVLARLIWKPVPRDAAPTWTAPAAVVGVTCSLLVLAVHFWLWAGEMGRVFSSYDAIASWNRWALAWAANKWPQDTFTYPQLLPANWSLAYVMTGSREGEMFARAVMGAFPALVLVGIIDLQRRLREPWLAVSAGAAFLLFMQIADEQNRFDGMADAPVAALGFAGVYFLLIARQSGKFRPWIILAAASLSAACVTKQAGLMITALAGLWIATDRPLRDTVRKSGRTGWWALIFTLFCAVHWPLIRWIAYAPQELHLTTTLVGDIHQGRGAWARTAHSFSLLEFWLRDIRPADPLIAFLLLPALAHPLGRRMLFYFALPSFAVWVLAFSYDIRNVASAIPGTALAAGFGAAQFASWMKAAWSRIWIHGSLAKRCLTAGGALVVTILALSFIIPFSNESLAASFRVARRSAGDREINRAIVVAMRDHGDGKILTSYLQLLIQPGTGKYATHDGQPLKEQSATGDKLGGYQWLVLESRLPDEQESRRTRLLNEGRLQEIARTAAWVLYRIRDTPSSSQKP